MGKSKRTTVATVGYQAATVDSFLQALGSAGVELLVDVRAVASSRASRGSASPAWRPPWPRSGSATSTSAVSARRPRGGPPPARAATRGCEPSSAPTFAPSRRRPSWISSATSRAAATRLCLLCFEADPEHCHRTLVIEALAALLPLDVLHLRPADTEP